MAAPAILWRYIMRQIATYTALAVCAFGLLILVETLLRCSRMLGVASGNALLIGQILRVTLPAYLSYLLPASFLCAVMLTLARMSADGEILAMRASGLGMSAVILPVMALGVICVGFAGWICLDLEPRSGHELKRLVRHALLSTQGLIDAGKVRGLGDERTLYVQSTGDETCPLEGIVISDFREVDRPYYVSANCGRMVALESEDRIALDLSRGAVHLLHPGTARYDRIEFDGSRVELDMNDVCGLRKRIYQYSLAELLGDLAAGQEQRSTIIIELHRRIAFALSALVLGLLGIPLGISPVRQGRCAGVLAAVVVVGAYWCVFTAVELAVVRAASPWPLWIPNLAVLALAGVLLRRSDRGEL